MQKVLIGPLSIGQLGFLFVGWFLTLSTKASEYITGFNSEY